MDSSFVVKPRAVAAKSHALRDPVPVRGAVSTELDHNKSVAAPGHGSDRPDDHGRRDEQHRPSESHADHAAEVVVDADSRAMLYRERDISTAAGEHPDHALMRQRAYLHAPAFAPSTAPQPLDELHADVKA